MDTEKKGPPWQAWCDDSSHGPNGWYGDALFDKAKAEAQATKHNQDNPGHNAQVL